MDAQESDMSMESHSILSRIHICIMIRKYLGEEERLLNKIDFGTGDDGERSYARDVATEIRKLAEALERV